ncbi:MAG: HAD family hydrolase [Pseudomonadota bacterium]
MKIAMWSGPRNLSTAMMYAFAARGDCAVIDEPFYAAYLAATGLDHPMRQAVLESQPQDPARVVEHLRGPVPGGLSHYYQKHMTHHMLPSMPRDWMREVTNVFLIRHPARVIASYVAKRENPTLDDIGFSQQVELFNYVNDLHGNALVVDSFDIRQNPRSALARLCEAIEISFTDAMLSWPKGGHESDGVWAAHWYGAVWNSTGFADPEGPLPEIPDHLAPVLTDAIPLYQSLFDQKI